MTECHIGLGANLDDPVARLNEALRWLEALDTTRILDVSPFYRTTPVGPQDQPDFINAVARLETSLAPLALLDALQACELRAGRVRSRHWGPRTLDLDLLLYGDLVLDEPRLLVPHPRIGERAFVLVPLHDVSPDLVLPGGEHVAELRQRCANDGVWYHCEADWRDSR